MKFFNQMIEVFAHHARKASLGQERTRNLAVSRGRGYEQDAFLFTLYDWIQSVFFRPLYGSLFSGFISTRTPGMMPRNCVSGSLK